MRLIAFALLFLPLPALADAVVDRVVDDVALPAVTRFADVTGHLAEAAQSDCTATSADLVTAWNDAMDVWFAVQPLRTGPLEDAALRQSIAYWPDTQGHRQRALSRILQGQDPILKNPENYGIEPVSARGLYALEAMLFDPAFNAYGPNDPGCTLIRAASRDLAAQAAVLRDAWKPGFAEVLKTAGSAENTRFLDATEARQALFTALLVSLQFDINERLGLPMGSFDKPRPLRAEGRLSNRAQRNLELSLQGQQALAFALIPAKGDAVAMREDFERVLWMVQKLYDPDFAGVDDPGKRFKLEALQTALVLLRTAVNEELSAALGVTMGLNALDGD